MYVYGVLFIHKKDIPEIVGVTYQNIIKCAVYFVSKNRSDTWKIPLKFIRLFSMEMNNNIIYQA